MQRKRITTTLDQGTPRVNPPARTPKNTPKDKITIHCYGKRRHAKRKDMRTRMERTTTTIKSTDNGIIMAVSNTSINTNITHTHDSRELQTAQNKHKTYHRQRFNAASRATSRGPRPVKESQERSEPPEEGSARRREE